MRKNPESESSSFYLGVYESKPDAKSRVSLPVAFRNAAALRGPILDQQLEFILMHDARNGKVVVFDPTTLKQKLSTMSEAQQAALGFSALHRRCDATGRLILSGQTLSALAQQVKDPVVFVGCLDYFEILSVAKWNEIKADREAGLQAFLDTLSLPGT
jgi:DNA-binding transcriptional regulator/RsmH inhibitor MraZ